MPGIVLSLCVTNIRMVLHIKPCWLFTDCVQIARLMIVANTLFKSFLCFL